MSRPSDLSLKILYLDNHLIAVCKPPGILTQSDYYESESLMGQVKKWIQTEFQKPGNVFLGLIHRLDRNVSGVVLFARTSKGASRLSKQFREKTTQKIYRTIVEGKPNPKQTKLCHHLRKEKSLKSTVFQRPGKDTQYAELEYKTLENYPDSSLLEVKLYTGRFHQIRAQLAFIGHPISGDKKYGAATTLPEKKIALYAHRLIFEHPISKEEVCVESPPPTYWPMR
ncbi:MAG: RNA pseudouridine synthase [Nitrosomonadaceae bacterium]|nr:RNA pseudouridine synthase [Nitrosomonadaceae bacterium]